MEVRMRRRVLTSRNSLRGWIGAVTRKTFTHSSLLQRTPTMSSLYWMPSLTSSSRTISEIAAYCDADANALFIRFCLLWIYAVCIICHFPSMMQFCNIYQVLLHYFCYESTCTKNSSAFSFAVFHVGLDSWGVKMYTVLSDTEFVHSVKTAFQAHSGWDYMLHLVSDGSLGMECFLLLLCRIVFRGSIFSDNSIHLTVVLARPFKIDWMLYQTFLDPPFTVPERLHRISTTLMEVNVCTAWKIWNADSKYCIFNHFSSDALV